MICLEDTKQSLDIFDSITYSKGSAVLKQLVFLIGERAFQKTLKFLFSKYKWGNINMNHFFNAIYETVKEE